MRSPSTSCDTRSMTMSWIRIAALLVIVGLAAWAIKRAGRDLRAQLGDKSKGPVLTPDEMKAVVERGLATQEQLSAMRPAEQRLLAASAVAMRAAQTQRRTREQ